MSERDLYNEEELLKLVAAGNEEAFRKLMLTYQPLLLTYVFQLTKSATLAEEIVQDVFLKIWISRDALVDVQRFSSYLFIICRNYTLDQLRKIAREKVRADKWENEQQAALLTPADPAATFFTLLDEAIDRLPPQQQKVYLMARRDKLTHAAIARETGLSTLTVKKYMKLAIASISRFIRSHMHLLPWIWALLLTHF